MAYATRTDLARFGLPAAVLSGIADADQDEALEAASDLADDYLRSAYDVPLVTWSHSLRRHVCAIAAYDLLAVRGFAPEGSDAVIVARYDAAIRWLESVRDGKGGAAAAVDATPASGPNDPVIYCDEPRDP